MRCIYKTDNGVLSKLKDFEPDVWVNLITPDMDEIVSTAKQYGIDVNDMKAALDDEESSRVQLEDGYTLILVDIPSAEVRNNQNAYTTIPLGILLVRNAIITVCGTETPVLTYFHKISSEDSRQKEDAFCVSDPASDNQYVSGISACY